MIKTIHTLLKCNEPIPTSTLMQIEALLVQQQQQPVLTEADKAAIETIMFTLNASSFCCQDNPAHEHQCRALVQRLKTMYPTLHCCGAYESKEEGGSDDASDDERDNEGDDEERDDEGKCPAPLLLSVIRTPEEFASVIAQTTMPVEAAEAAEAANVTVETSIGGGASKKRAAEETFKQSQQPRAKRARTNNNNPDTKQQMLCDVNGAGRRISVTKALSAFFPFDAANSVCLIQNSPRWQDDQSYKYYRASEQQIKNLWRESMQRGERVHKLIECDLIGRCDGAPSDDAASFRQYLRFKRDFLEPANLRPVRVEGRVDTSRHFGYFDALFSNDGGQTHVLIDWKCSNNRLVQLPCVSDPQQCCFFPVSRALGPFWHLNKTQPNKYAVQINMLRAMLEQRVRIAAAFLVRLAADGFEVALVHREPTSDAIDALLLLRGQ